MQEAELSPWHGSADQEAPDSLTSATDLLLAWMPGNTANAGGPWDAYFAGSSAAPKLPVTVPDEIWDAESANSAIDCLFRFVHALERCDIAESMACLSPGYHTFDKDREWDRESMRGKLEYAFDVWRRQTVSLSLAEVPDPVFHPAGILIHTTLQIDSKDASGNCASELLRRMVVFEETLRDGWLIVSLAAVS